MDARIEKLSQMLDRHFHHWTEAFKDEETGEEVSLDRREINNAELSDDEKRRIDELVTDSVNISTEDIWEIFRITAWFDYRPFDSLYLELVKRGQVDMASNIKNLSILQELCDKGNQYAAWELYEKYRYGEEEYGYFINKPLAKKYHDRAQELGFNADNYEEWDDEDHPGEPYPRTFEYVLTGSADSLNGVQNLIKRLCERFGIPENEDDGLGMYVPQRVLMKVLVGSDTEYYRGNVLYLEREAPDRLVITTEADKGEPLLYALRQCFENLTVDLED